MLLWFLRLFTWVRELEASTRAAVDARIEAEARRDAALAQLEEAHKARVESSERIADVLCRRYLGHRLSDINPTEDPALEPLPSTVAGPKILSTSQRQALAAKQLRQQLEEYFAESTG